MLYYHYSQISNKWALHVWVNEQIYRVIGQLVTTQGAVRKMAIVDG